MASTQSQAVRRNAVRFDLMDDLQMDRLQFSRLILQKELGFATNQLEYIFAYPGKKIFEVIFTTFQLFESCLETFESKKSLPRFSKISMTPLAERDLKTVHVMIFSEKVKNQDVWTWMTRYCEVINAMEVMDIDGIKTGSRRFQVRLQRKDGVLQHLPSSIQLGAFRGSVFYPGQPKECRKCGSLSHLAAACTQDICRICRSTDHTSAQCPAPVKCNLCSSTNHRFKDCPLAYSNRVKISASSSTIVVGQEPSAEETDPPHATTSDANPTLQPNNTDGQQPSEELTLDQQDESSDGETVLDWSAEPESEAVSIPDTPSTSTVATTTLDQVSRPNPELSIKTAMTLQDAGSILDSLMAGLPSPSGPRRSTLTESLLLDARPDSSVSQARKRNQESPRSGESSPSHPTGLSQNDWPLSSPTSRPFLEPSDVLAFSSTTLIKEMAPKKDMTVKSKKPKLK